MNDHNAPRPPREMRSADKLRHTRILYASVAGVTLLIIAMWAFIVPPQLKGFSLFDEEDRQGWAEIKATTDDESVRLHASLDAMKAVLEEASAEEDASAETQENAPALDENDIATLRARIEAANQKNHTESDDNGQ